MTPQASTLFWLQEPFFWPRRIRRLTGIITGTDAGLHHGTHVCDRHARSSKARFDCGGDPCHSDMTMANDDLITSAVSRLFSLGSLVGRVGVSVAGSAVAGLFRAADEQARAKTEAMIRNATRALETLGALKGVPMKLGQMLSLHEDLLPPEVAAILRGLQREAPPIAFSAIQGAIDVELKDRVRRIASIEPNVYAAASIGQVHRGRLTDGRDVVFKVQYPGIDRVIAADMKNLRGVLNLLFSTFSSADFQAVWSEVDERLREELDYEREARNIVRMAELQKDNSQIQLPEVVPECSGRTVLCMTLVEGISAAQVASRSQEERDAWARTLIQTTLDGLFRTRFLHADPNLANFAFLPEGCIIMYDFGCMKEIPAEIALGLARVARAVLDERDPELPELLGQLGVRKKAGGPLPLPMLTEYAALLRTPFREAPPYRFGGEHNFYDDILTLGRRWWTEGLGLDFPRDVVFIDRTLNGHFGNLVRLRAQGPWRELLSKSIAPLL